MLSLAGSVHVDASPREVLEFVCDLRAYMLLDHKIVNVYECSPPDAAGDGHIVMRGSMRGIRSPKQRMSLKLDRWRSVVFESDGPWLTDRVFWMRGEVDADQYGGGSFVRHSYRFRFKGPFGPLIERYLRAWLQRDLGDELQRIKTHFDRRAAGLPPLEVAPRRPDPSEEQRTRARIGRWKDYRPPTV